MGGSSWSDDAYNHLKKSYSNVSADDIFVNNKTGTASNSMQSQNIKFRESRDSDVHPDSLSIAVFLDVTGSMGRIPEILAREKLGSLMNTLIKNGIEHPQIMFGAIGDHHSDKYPLQVGQFESGTQELVHDLSNLYIEGGGGGTNQESYLLAWLFCARHTSCDCFEQRGQKGYLFTIGDEKSWDKLTAADIKKITGKQYDGKQSNATTDKELLQEVMRSYNVYHLHINEGSYRNDKNVLGYWKILGDNLFVIDNYKDMDKIISQIILKSEKNPASLQISNHNSSDTRKRDESQKPIPTSRYEADEYYAEYNATMSLTDKSTEMSLTDKPADTSKSYTWVYWVVAAIVVLIILLNL